MTATSLRNQMSLAVMLTASLFAGCSDASGPGDTTIELAVDPIPSPSNNRNPTVAGTTDRGARVTAASPEDTLSAMADDTGAFSLTVRLRRNAVNTITVLAVDSAGNEIGDSLVVAHDGRIPVVDFASPLQGETTAGQSGFTIAVDYIDQLSGDEFVSGVDPTSLQIESDGTVGGIFQRDGTISTAHPAGTNLAPFFDELGAADATLLVPDSLAFEPGTAQLRVQVTDMAGNLSPPSYLAFEVTADPDRLIAVDASGAAGSSDNWLPVALINANSIAGVQFDLVYSTSVIAGVGEVRVADRAAAFSATAFNEVAPGRVRVLLFDVDGDTVEPGQGLILSLSLTVQPDAAAGPHTLTLTNVLLSDPGGNTSQSPDATGTFVVP